MWLLRGRFRTSDLLVIAVALVAATAATILLTRQQEQLSETTRAEGLLREIDRNEDELYDLSYALLSGDAHVDDLRRVDAAGARSIEEIQTLDPTPYKIFTRVVAADDLFRQNLHAQLALVAAQSTGAAEYQRKTVFPAHRALAHELVEAEERLGARHQRLRHEVNVISIAAALLAVLGIALGMLLANRTKRARTKVQRVQLAAENQRLRDQTAVAELVMHVARAADSTDSVERLLERTLGLVCFYAGWPLGHLWVPASAGGFEPSGIWHCEETGRYPVFRKATAELEPAAGDDTLPGRAAATGEPVWIDDISSSGIPRAGAASADGLVTGLAFPIVADGEVVAVFELFTDRPLPKDRALVEITRALAVQLGDFVERKAADVERRRLAAIVASSGDAILATDADGPVTSWNAAAEELSGYPVYEIVGQHIAKLFPRERRRDLARLAEMLERGEAIRNFETKLKRRSGELFDTCVTVAPLDRGLGYAITFRDVTELRDAQERYQRLVEQLPLVLYVDGPSADGTFWNGTYVSPQIESLLGHTSEQWLPMPYRDAIHPEDRDWVVAAHEDVYATHEDFDHEYRLLHRDGTTVWVRDQMIFVRDEHGKPLFAQGYLLDITRRKEYEAQLDGLLAGEREQNDQLRELDRLKDEFVALVSHELRTPLTSIRGYLELVLDGAPGDLTAEQRQFLCVVERNSDRLLRLVGDPRAELVGDRARLAQLVDNLVSNAIKFTPAGGRVEVAVYARPTEVVIEVSDSGMGISAEEQERLFQRFFRTAAATSQTIPGTGLGLAISKAIVDAHEGKLELESGEGSGTTFRITIPADVNLMEEAA